MMLGLLTFTIFNFLITISLEVLIFEKKFSVFSKMVQATTSPFSVSPSSLRRNSCLKGPLKYLLMPLLGKNQLAITLHMYASIGPNLDNTHRGQILSSS